MDSMDSSTSNPDNSRFHVHPLSFQVVLSKGGANGRRVAPLVSSLFAILMPLELMPAWNRVT